MYFDQPINENAHLALNQGRWQDLKEAKQRGTNISITSLSHFTTKENADAIVNSGGFRGGIKKITEDAERNNVEATFSWWSPKFDEAVITEVRDTLVQVIQPFLAYEDNIIELQNQVATSDAFKPNPARPRYGCHYFQYGINNLCHYYGNFLDDEVQFKILGTFGYKQEVMHAVLV